MYTTPEQFAAANKASVDALFTIAKAQFAACERLAALNFNTTKAAFEDGINQAKVLMSVKGDKELVNLVAAAPRSAVEKVIAYSRNVYEVASQTKAEVANLVESQTSEINKNLVSLLDNATKDAPAGAEYGVTAVKSALAAANSAYDNYSKVIKQATDAAEQNVSAATAALVKAASITVAA